MSLICPFHGLHACKLKYIVLITNVFMHGDTSTPAASTTIYFLSVTYRHILISHNSVLQRRTLRGPLSFTRSVSVGRLMTRPTFSSNLTDTNARLRMRHETRGGVVQLLKDKGITTSEECAQSVERADKGSSVREVGLRVKMEYLFSSAAKHNAVATWYRPVPTITRSIRGFHQSSAQTS